MTDDLKVRPGETLGDYSRRRGLCLPEEMRVALYVHNGGPMPNGWALPLGAHEAHRCQGNSVRCLACERAAPAPPRSVSELPSPDREIVCKWLRALHEIADIVGVPPGESITDSAASQGNTLAPARARGEQ